MPIRRSTRNIFLNLLICLSLIGLFNGCANDPGQTSAREYTCHDVYIYVFEERALSTCGSGIALFVDYGRDDNCDEDLSADEIENVYHVCSEEYAKPIPSPTPNVDASPSPTPTPESSPTPVATATPFGDSADEEKENQRRCPQDLDWIWNYHGHHKHKWCIEKRHR